MASTPTDELPQYHYQRFGKCYSEDLDGKKLLLMLIPSGVFDMGSPQGRVDSKDNERPQHRVAVQQFLMGRYPVTQEQWKIVAEYDPIDKELSLIPSRFEGDHRPVEQVSWEDAQEFCRRLSIKSGKNYRLPSEAQWEYACRSGSTTPFHFGHTITSNLSNYRGLDDETFGWLGSYDGGPRGIFRQETTDVGIFPANDWGLHDMHGNVWEWCEDSWHDTYERAPKDAHAWTESEHASETHVLRGGSWFNAPGDCRSSVRLSFQPDFANFYTGFRVCCIPPKLIG